MNGGDKWTRLEGAMQKLAESTPLDPEDQRLWTSFTSVAARVIEEEPFELSPARERQLWQDELGRPSLVRSNLGTRLLGLAAAFSIGVVAMFFVSDRLPGLRYWWHSRFSQPELASLSPNELNYGKNNEWKELGGVFVALVREADGQREVKGKLLQCTKEQHVGNEWRLLDGLRLSGLTLDSRPGDRFEIVLLGYRSIHSDLIGLSGTARDAEVEARLLELVRADDAALETLRDRTIGGRFRAVDPTGQPSIAPLTTGAAVKLVGQSHVLEIEKLKNGKRIAWLRLAFDRFD